MQQAKRCTRIRLYTEEENSGKNLRLGGETHAFSEKQSKVKSKE